MRGALSRVFAALVDPTRRDAFLATGMETGVREGYERLDEVLRGP